MIPFSKSPFKEEGLFGAMNHYRNRLTFCENVAIMKVLLKNGGSVQLIIILLVAVAILVVLSGFAVFVGSRKSERVSSGFFLAATIFGALWALSIGIFLILSPESKSIAPLAVVGIYSAALFLDTCLVAHVGWRYKIGKFCTVLFGVWGVFIVGLLLTNHEILYTDIILSNEGNKVVLTDGWFYWAYLAFFSLITFVMLGLLVYRISKSSNRGRRMGLLILLVGLSFTGTISLIFDLLLPFWVTYDLIWVGPITMAASIIAYYYAILRYKVISLDARWLKVMSYAIILASTAVVYMLIFFALFMALFKVPNPSPAIMILNLVMVIIVLLMTPVVRELTAFIRSLVQTDKIDLPYIVKKVDRMTIHRVNLNELVDFLSDHLHFGYVGILIDGRLYESAPIAITGDEVLKIAALPSPGNGIWQEPTKDVAAVFKRFDIRGVAELHNASGVAFGQLLIGKPHGRITFSRRELIQLEMAISLVSTAISPSQSSKRRPLRRQRTKRKTAKA